MKTRKVIFALFFTLGLVVFVFVAINFSGDLLRNKKVFTASLAQDEPEVIMVVESAPEPEELPAEAEEVIVSVAVYLKQDQIDDILEKIDLLQQQIADLRALEKRDKEEIALVDPEEKVDEEDIKDEPKITDEPIVVLANQGSGGGITFPPIVISEVQIAGSTDSKQEFVELYNPNTEDVNLDNWYLQRKTKTGANYSSFASSTLFAGKKISAQGYFLIAREDAGFARHLTVTAALTDDNSLVLKNPNGDIVDKLGWAEASDFETAPAVNPPDGKSIGRKFADNNETDTNNNLADFEIDVPTPIAQNVAYVEPPPPPPVVEIPLENILISQVQTEGLTVKDEFVQLHNPNDVEVDLAGFALKKKTASGNESNLVSAGGFTGIIPAQGYFLIAPQDNDDGTKNYTGQVQPDLRYSGQSFSIASGNTILLYDADEVLMDEYITSDDIPPRDPPPDEAPPDDPPPDDPLPPVETKVVINEIAWMGYQIGGKGSDEWMELFNAGETVVDLSGWTLTALDGTPAITLTGSIDAGGFYLLERTDDDSVPNVPADKMYIGPLSNGGEDLQLKDVSGNIKDEVNSAGLWFAGDNATKKTMQRKDAAVFGSDPNNWQTSEISGGSPRN